MWPWELTAEFWSWLWGATTYSFAERKAQKTKYNLYLLCTVVSFWLALVYDTDFIQYTLSILWVDIGFYVIRRLWIQNRYKEPHLFLFIHMFMHIFIIVWYFWIIHVAFIAYAPRTEKEDFKRLFYVSIPLSLRVLVYTILTGVTILFCPCILHSVLKKRRERRGLYERIRLARNSGSIAVRNDSILSVDQIFQGANNNNPEVDQLLLNPNMFENPPQIVRRPTIQDALLNLLQGMQPIQRGLDNFDRLKRVSYEAEKNRLDYDECSICIMPFGEEPDEVLIYLPCNRKHIFHEDCIIQWLKHERDCPLWKAPVNNDTLNRYDN